MAFVIDSPRSWTLSQDKEGYRVYKLVIRVVSSDPPDPHDGPATALLTPGLPLIGSPYAGYENTDDFWCWCQPNASVTPVSTNGGNIAFDCEFEFSNKPVSTNKQRCNTFRIEDPLLEPQKMTLSFTKTREEATADRFSEKLLTSSHEQIRGPQVEFDEMQPAVKIEQNVAQLQPELLAYIAANPLNDAPLWGLPARCIKVSEISAEEKFLGLCEYYYTRHFSFEAKVKIDPRTGAITSGWDHDAVDEGTKVLRGHWSETSSGWELDEINGSPPNPYNPAHFIRYQDRNGNTARVILDGAGKPYIPASTEATNECDQCPEDEGGAPAIYQLWGFTGVGPGPVTLNIQTGCAWSGLGDDSETFYDLSFSGDSDSGEGQWLLSTSAGGTWTLDVPDKTWNCWGSNTLERNSGSGPAFVFIQPQTASQPGNRHIEKYGQSNLLLLRIPLVLGVPTPP